MLSFAVSAMFLLFPRLASLGCVTYSRVFSRSSFVRSPSHSTVCGGVPPPEPPHFCVDSLRECGDSLRSLVGSSRGNKLPELPPVGSASWASGEALRAMWAQQAEPRELRSCPPSQHHSSFLGVVLFGRLFSGNLRFLTSLYASMSSTHVSYLVHRFALHFDRIHSSTTWRLGGRFGTVGSACKLRLQGPSGQISAGATSSTVDWLFSRRSKVNKRKLILRNTKKYF